jgi:sec-independent protein translocase protein TatB
MLDIGFSEFLVVIILAILVLGPDKLPEAMKDVARFVKKTKKLWDDATRDIVKELELEDMKEEVQRYKQELKKLQNETKLPNINDPLDGLGNRSMKDFLNTPDKQTGETNETNNTTKIKQN